MAFEQPMRFCPIAQGIIHAGLPAIPCCLECLEHIDVEPNAFLEHFHADLNQNRHFRAATVAVAVNFVLLTTVRPECSRSECIEALPEAVAGSCRCRCF
jgi:hypothetical protein